jgi:hypothetical protein
MTVQRIAPGILTGLTTDTKPTTYPIATIFIDDKGNFYKWNGTNWVLIVVSGSTYGRKTGKWFPSAGVAGEGLLRGYALNNVAAGGTIGSVGFATFAASDGSKGARFTAGNVSGATIGYTSSTSLTLRSWNPRFKAKFRLNNKADNRFFMGWNATGAILTTDDPLNAKTGIAFGKISDATNTNFVIMHNDVTGATVLDTVAAADNALHQIEIIADDTNTKFMWSFDNGVYHDITTDIPASSALGFAWNSETTNTTTPSYDVFWIEMESD